MKALIVAAGDPPSEEVFLKNLRKCDLSIAADNGLGVYYKYNKTPDVIIGDFDSAEYGGKDDLDGYKSLIIKLPVEKNITDTEAAVDYALKNGTGEIILLGATGKRIDHLIANLMLLRGSLNKNIKLIIEDDEHEIYAANGKCIVEGFRGQTISLFPLDEAARVNAISGLYYPLDNLLLKNTHSRGISNLLTEEMAVVETNKPLLVVKIKKKI